MADSKAGAGHTRWVWNVPCKAESREVIQAQNDGHVKGYKSQSEGAPNAAPHLEQFQH